MPFHLLYAHTVFEIYFLNVYVDGKGGNGKEKIGQRFGMSKSEREIKFSFIYYLFLLKPNVS